MRVLFSTTAGTGHFGPLVPFARACRDAGHEVTVAAPAPFAESVARVGLDHEAFPEVPREIMGPLVAGLEKVSFEEANDRVIQDVFGRLDAQAALPTMTQIIERWRPDVVVRELCEFGSLAAAERAGVPHVQVAIGMHDLCVHAEPLLVDPLGELGALAGVPDGRLTVALKREPVFTTVPERLDQPQRSEPDDEWGRIIRFRDASATSSRGSLPAQWGDPAHPLVYVTFGTVAASLGQFDAVFGRTLEALADLPVRVLLTTGEAGDPEALKPWPANAHVERWWPQAEIMSRTSAVIGHGGFGTMMTALAAGVPQVVVPMFTADQRLNAERIEAAGVGVHVEGGTSSAAYLPVALMEVLGHPEYGSRARSLATEMAALPDASAAVGVLADLAARRLT